ncbi:MAG: efflux RND transporter periplasmic adaptor subunit [Myxococcales bacterium]
MDTNALLLVLLSVVGAAACDGGKADAKKAGPPKGGGPDRPARVEVARAEAGNVARGWSFLAQVQPALESELASAVAGHVLEVRAREGDAVEEGQTLVVLDSRKARATLAAAKAKVSGTEAELAQARRQLARVQDMNAPTVSAPERERFQLSVDSLAARLEAERAEVQRLQVEVSQHTVGAPFAGAVKARLVDPGAWVESGTPLLQLVSQEQLEVHADVSAEIGSHLKVGDTARLVDGSHELPARIEGIVDALDPTTRTMLVRLSPQTDERRPSWLRSGRALQAAFEVTLEGEGVLVPRDAVLRGALDTRVMAVVDGKSEALTVEVLAPAGDRLLVRGDGLDVGTQVIVRGNERLSPGQPVEVAE